MPIRPEDRGRIELTREEIENLGTFIPDSRNVSSMRSPVDRLDEERHQNLAAEADDSKWANTLLKLGFATAGIWGMGKLLHSSQIGVELLSSIGKVGRNINKAYYKTVEASLKTAEAWTSNPNRMVALQAMIKRRESVGSLGNIHQVERLQEAISFVETHGKGGLNILPTNLRRSLQRLFKPRGTVPQSHTHLSVGDVLTDYSRHGLVSSQQADILRKGVHHGIISSESALGRGIYRNLETGAVRNVQWAYPGNMARGAIGALNHVRIPILGFRIGQFFQTAADIFAKRGGVTQLKAGMYVPELGIRTTAPSVLVGEELFIRTGWSQYVKAAGKYQAHKLGRSSASQTAGAFYGTRLDPRLGKGVVGAFEKATGIGPSHANERSFFSKFVLDPIRRMARGKLQPKQQVRRRDTLSGMDSIYDRQINVDMSIAEYHKYLDELIDNPAVGQQPLGFIEKLRATFGKGKHYEYVGEGFEGAIKGISTPKAGIPFPGQSDHFLVAKGDRLGLFMNWLGYRQNDLISMLTGVGFAPGAGRMGFLSSAARIAGVGALAYGAIQAGRYADYQLESMTGVSPVKVAAYGYTRARLGLTFAREQLGITDASRYLEELMPLSMTSAASGMARSFLPPLLGGMAAGKTGLIAGAGISALIGGLPGGMLFPEDITKSYEDLRREYAGEKRVPVRANRFWEFSSETWTGGKVKYYKPSWYTELMADAKFTDVRYGSKKNYFRNVTKFPNPSNLFGLIPQMQPGWLAEKQAIRRPYPVAPGSLIKRPKMLMGAMPPDQGLDPFGMGRVDAGVSASNPYSMQNRFSETTERISEFLGAYKFLGETILGTQGMFKPHQVLASAGEMDSIHKGYWEAELGGLFGISEIVRRYVLPQNALARSVNPLPNVMPCLPPGVSVLMFNGGLKKSEDIEVGDVLVSKDGDPNYVKEIGKFSCNRIIEIETYGNNLFSQRFSPNHPIYTDNHEFVLAEDIKVGDYVAFPIRKYESGEDAYIDMADMLPEIGEQFSITDEYIYYSGSGGPEYEISERYNFDVPSIPIELKRTYPKIYKICDYRSKSTHVKKLKRVKRFWLEKDLYFLLGVFAAEGSFSKIDKAFNLAGHPDDKWENRIRSIFQEYDIRYSVTDTPGPKTGGRKFVSSCVPITVILSTLCPGHAREKHFVPKALEHIVQHESILELIRGLIDGDGYYFFSGNRVKLGLKTTSELLAYQFRNLVVDTFGFSPSITLAINSFGRDVIDAIISGEDADIVAESIGYEPFGYTAKQNNKKQYSDQSHIYIKVKTVREINEETFVIGHHVSGDCTFCVAIFATHNTWIPGERSVFDEDTKYMYDFHRGDAYRAVAKGEIRLPGPGYESIYRMHSGVAARYDPMDRYLILSDIAPYSQAYRHYKAIVKGWIASGTLDKYWTEKFDEREEEVGVQRIPHRFTERKFSGNERTLEAINKAAQYGGVERSIGAGWEWFTHDALSTIPYAGKFLKARTPYQSYLENEVYGEQFQQWARPYEAFMRPYIYKSVHRNPIMAPAETGFMLGGMMGATPLSKIGMGLGFGALTAAVSAKSMLTKGTFVPPYRRREWELMGYFDKLEYVRAKRLEGMAMMGGNASLAEMYREDASKTVVGMPSHASLGQMQASVPSTIKPYFRNLLEIQDPEVRQEILETIPEHARQVFQRAWGMSKNVSENPDQQVSQYFSRFRMPDDNWLGWHPDVPFNVSKIKFVESGANSVSNRLHHFGLWSFEKYENAVAYSQMEVPPIDLSPILPSTNQTGLERELYNVSVASGMMSAQPFFEPNLNLGSMFNSREEMMAQAKRFIGGGY